MPRTAREKSESDIYHVMVRGIDRAELFYDDEDRHEFLRRLERYRDTCGLTVYAWCLMANHAHLLMKVDSDELAKAMKRLLLSYSRYFNAKYDRVGYLFQDRYKSKPVNDDAYFLTVLRYIVRNPLEAGDDLTHWTSFDETCNGGGIIDHHYVLGLFANDEEKARCAFARFIESEGAYDERSVLTGHGSTRIKDSEAVEMIREASGLSNCLQLCDLPRTERNGIIADLRGNGLSIRQIARLTGLNRGIVERATKR